MLGPAVTFAPGEGRLPEVLPGAQARSIFHLAHDPVYLGPLFCRAEWVFVGEDTVEGLVRAPRQREIFAHIGSPRFKLDPMMLDTAFQVAANWDGHHRRVVSIPMGVASIELGRPRRLNEGAHVKARAVEVRDPEVFYDIEILGDDGAPLLRLERLWLRRLDSRSRS